MAASFEPAKVVRYFLFNPIKFGLREDNDFEKIMYFWPDSLELSSLMMDVGLCEALINIPKTFTSEPTTSCCTKKCRYILHSPEPGWWLVMVVQNPKAINKDGTEQWQEDALDDIPLLAMLKRSYADFYLQHGSYEALLSQGDEIGLREKLKEYIPAIIAPFQLQHADLFSSLDGIHFLPVDKNVYLRVQSFLNVAENELDCVKASAFLYKEYLMWSGLEQDDMRALYRWLTREGGILSGPTATGNGFVIGPKNPNDRNSSIPLTRIYLQGETHSNSTSDSNATKATDDGAYLVVYQHDRCICVFIIDASMASKHHFYSQLQRIIMAHVEFLAPIINEHARQITEISHYKYIYFNRMNLALKTSLKGMFEKAQVPTDLIRVLNQMHSDFKKVENIDEILVGTLNDGWLVGRKSDQREFYVLFDQKSANLLEIADEVRKLNASYFRDIFMDES